MADIEQLLREARESRERRDYERGLNFAVQAFQLAPTDARVAHEKALCLRLLHRLDEAEQVLRQGSSNHPRDIPLRREVGLLLYDWRKYRAALQAFARVRELAPKDETSLAYAVACLRMDRDYQGATKAALDGLRELPSNPRLLNQEAFIYFDQIKYREARDAFAKVLALSPDDETALASTVACHRRLKDFKKAEDCAHAGLRKLPRSSRLLNELAFIAYDQSSYRKALEIFVGARDLSPDDETALTSIVTCHRRLKDFTAAEAAARQAVKVLPYSVRAALEYARVSEERGLWVQATERFMAALALDDRQEDAVAGRLRCLYRQDQNAAMKELGDALGSFKDSAIVILTCGELLLDNGERERAGEQFARASQLAPDWLLPAYRRVSVLASNNRLQEAEDELRQIIGTCPQNDDGEAQAELGFLFLRRNEVARAEREFNEILARNPANFHGCNGKAWILYHKEKWTEAAAAFAKLALAYPDKLVLGTNRARALSRIGSPKHLKDAKALCEGVLKKDPIDAEALNTLGVVHFKLQRLRDAEDALKRAVILAPRSGACRDLGALYAKQERLAEAKKQLKRAVQIDPADASTHIELGAVYLDLGERDRGLKHLRRATIEAPESTDALQALARGLTREGDLAGAERVLRQGLERLQPASCWALHIVLASVLTQIASATGDDAAAQDALEESAKAIRLRKNEPDGYFEQGRAFDAAGRSAQALHSFKKVLKRSPYHREALLNVQRLKRVMHEQNEWRWVGRIGRWVSVGALAGLSLLWAMYLRQGIPPQAMIAAHESPSISQAVGQLWPTNPAQVEVAPGPDADAPPVCPARLDVRSEKMISSEMMLSFMPMLLGLIVVGLVLPYLSKVKLLGIEAELLQAHPTIGAGPSGGIGSHSMVSGLVGRRNTPIASGPK
jgi:tetratricopeptide (TPR) repeat protein